MRQVAAEIDELVDVLRELPAGDWERPSACDGFRVRDVAAHLALVGEPLRAPVLKGLTGTPTRAARIGGQMSVEFAAQHSTAELIELLEQRSAHPRRGFLGRIDPARNMLADHATHVQDVRVGLNRRAQPDAERARAVLDAEVRVWFGLTWGSRQRAKNVRLVAGDVDWVHGSGPEVSGPYDGLLLALSGRRAGLQFLTGAGLPTLAATMPAAA